MLLHWQRVTDGERGLLYDEFLRQIKALPKGQLWRHNQAGDLAGAKGKIDVTALKQLVKANAGRRGFSYTHYPRTAANIKAVKHANENGFTVNLSADSLHEADQLYALGLPLVTVVPPGWRGTTTPAGNPVTVCPAQVRDDIDCATCQLCSVATRRAVVAFEAHGARHKVVTKISLKEI